MHPLLDAAAERQHGVFSTAQARAAGLSMGEIQDEVRRGRWVRRHHGVYAARPLVDALAGSPRELHLLDCAAIRLALRRPFTLHLWSAVRFHDLRTLGPMPDVVCGQDEGEWRTGKGYVISGAALPREQTMDVGGWRVTSLPRTVVDAARNLSFMAGVVVADSALLTDRLSRDELTAAVLSCTHYKRIGRAARVCEFARYGAESVLESVSRVRLVAVGLPMPQLQVAIHDTRGFIGRTDMYWESLGVAGEVDGRIKYTDPYADRQVEEILWAEKLRMGRMEKAGLEVVRWTKDEVTSQPTAIRQRILEASDRAGRRTPAYRAVPQDWQQARAS